jgi:hypothetical protein
MRFEAQFLFSILVSIYLIPDCPKQSETDFSLSPFSRRWIYYKGQAAKNSSLVVLFNSKRWVAPFGPATIRAYRAEGKL